MSNTINKNASIPSLNPHFRLQYEKAQECFVLLFPEGMIKLNGSAGEIMNMVDGQRTHEDIIAELQAKYPEAGELGEQVMEFLAIAQEKQWVQYE
ncbi:pyrroloquinoline quinone biosynthesis peptide chaperone PqqD [Paraneptunicella aestuarii]|uniref:pyrroloquinoline quinone biosynthesis peptide chaperone PqqD n=1 Tax=Paraneptunicella aestuarii TaxID=2831148 RepID=UPI001E6186AD|nr:pyrroloquinoline quinone biosynthesis peptide chaperone PqqD [Paraneptunicella aestuarii]UAA39156.1 pyrroloquinoline quinone biosynthesis peptide chaperone PqqD [Paraneptunicella aestuarii]